MVMKSPGSSLDWTAPKLLVRGLQVFERRMQAALEFVDLLIPVPVKINDQTNALDIKGAREKTPYNKIRTARLSIFHLQKMNHVSLSLLQSAFSLSKSFG